MSGAKGNPTNTAFQYLLTNVFHLALSDGGVK